MDRDGPEIVGQSPGARFAAGTDPDARRRCCFRGKKKRDSLESR